MGIPIVFVASLVFLFASQRFPCTGQQIDIEARRLSDGVDSEKLREYLRRLTQAPHVAGTEEELDTAIYVRDKFLEFGLDSVKIVPYDVLLSYPDRERPNTIHILDGTGESVFSTLGYEEPLFAPEESSPRVFPTFSAYSAPGEPIGDLVYACYGRREDFQYLLSQGISAEGKIVLARYGMSFRGNIVKFAMEYGAIGVILYSDPKEYAPYGEDFVYPDSEYMPDMAVQSGTVMLANGDPTTPQWPSVPGAYRIPEAEADLPDIPVQPIGYREARILLENLAGVQAPPEWQGALNVTYRLGPGFAQPNWKVKMEVRTRNEMATVHNVIGILHGSVEPDRYVILGNHRDAWVFGAVDPSSGTASLLEIARLYGEAALEGNRPRRTLIFCSWGAEEYGLVGSLEWVEEHANVLADRAVINLNVDISVSGNRTLSPSGCPLTYQSLYTTTKSVGNPNPDEIAAGRPTVFHTWLHNFPSEDPDVPQVGNLGSGSDYAPFIHFLGIPSIDMSYIGTEEGDYALYHSLYETFHLVDYILDRGFTYMKGLTQVWIELADHYANSVLIPFDVRDYGKFLRRQAQDFSNTFETQLQEHGISLELWWSAIDNVISAADFFHGEHQGSLNLENPYEVRRFNDELMAVERVFIDSMIQSDARHLIYKPSSSDTYRGEVFGSLVDLLLAADPDWEKVKKGVSVVAHMIQSAANVLMGSLNTRGF
ncbi:unnamed protein product [Darwinula stevensoni]|uniref:Uncharacterized protein n=1 Tax=Darwinula stevensoni TaxID=69355 RepID=A0A7R9ADM6_9CRUS|nr:unnamed protein product [Darwinula stevensoni]CAG0901466.1 unnamed protein product [Darwinula stevensoni]